MCIASVSVRSFALHVAMVRSRRRRRNPNKHRAPIGAGFYLNATEEKWKNWRMYDYVVKELPALLGAYPLPNGTRVE